MSNEKLLNEFNAEMVGLYEKIVEVTEGKYKPTSFKVMVDKHDGHEVAKMLLGRAEISEGLGRLYELEMQEYSIEAIVQNKKWRSLFTDKELLVAESRVKIK